MPYVSYCQTLGASVKRPPNIDRQIRKLKKQKEKTVALIERYCKKKLVFAHPLLPFGTVREAHPQTTHLATPTHKLKLLLPKELFFCSRSLLMDRFSVLLSF
jgi:hypothetical protein